MRSPPPPVTLVRGLLPYPIFGSGYDIFIFAPYVNPHAGAAFVQSSNVGVKRNVDGGLSHLWICHDSGGPPLFNRRWHTMAPSSRSSSTTICHVSPSTRRTSTRANPCAVPMAAVV